MSLMDPVLARAHPAGVSKEEDVLALAESLASLSLATRETRTMLWSALQATQLIHIDREVATGLRQVEDLLDHTEDDHQEEGVEGGGNLSN